jgi:hypothetical protein
LHLKKYFLSIFKKEADLSEHKLFGKLQKKYENVLLSAEDIEKRIGLNIDKKETEE